jgi:superfamily II DNA or RNA helicase
VPYRYTPLFASLDDDEVQDYVEKTERIVRQFHAARDDEERSEFFDLLLFQRADIVKNARQKYAVLEGLLDKKLAEEKWSIVYCSPQQIDTVMKLVNDRWIPAHRFTYEEGTVPDSKFAGLSERDHLLKSFAEGKHHMLVAMKCLDEGVDVPPARTAVLMASSGNPREYVQRIGRLLRRHPGKDSATVFDVVVVPSAEEMPPGLREHERRIFSKELGRCEEIARAAINNAEALARLYSVRSRLEV